MPRETYIETLSSKEMRWFFMCLVKEEDAGNLVYWACLQVSVAGG